MSVLKYKDALGIWYKIPTIKGDKGDTGNQGAQGIPGVSPTITVSDITGGHRITITDAEHPGGISFDVMDGSDADAPVQDVQLPDGTSIVNGQGVAEIPKADTNTFGAIKVGNGLFIFQDKLNTDYATDANVKSGSSYYKPITPIYQHQAVFYGLAKAAGSDEKNSALPAGQYTDTAKSAIHEMLSGSISVTGTTPTINALPGLRYICGEVSTLTVNLPASGCVDIQFESGSTPTVLTVVPASGQTVKWANGFDPTSLDADTTYEINIADGLGVAVGW